MGVHDDFRRTNLYEAEWFDGWSAPIRAPGWCERPPPHPPPRTWLLRRGWRKHRLIHPDEIPGRSAYSKKELVNGELPAGLRGK